MAANETPTKAYTLVDASLNYDFNLSQLDMTAFIRGTNLTNELYQSYYGNDATTGNFGTALYSRTFALGVRYSM